jgi:hypothetical protein
VASVSLWSGDQDAPQRSHREGKRRAVLEDRWRLEQALEDSEDSVKLNTSVVERLNLTIRQLRTQPCRLV